LIWKSVKSGSVEDVRGVDEHRIYEARREEKQQGNIKKRREGSQTQTRVRVFRPFKNSNGKERVGGRERGRKGR